MGFATIATNLVTFQKTALNLVRQKGTEAKARPRPRRKAEKAAQKGKKDRCATIATRRVTFRRCALILRKIKAKEEQGKANENKAQALIHKKEKLVAKESLSSSLAWATSGLASQTRDGPKEPGT